MNSSAAFRIFMSGTKIEEVETSRHSFSFNTFVTRFLQISISGVLLSAFLVFNVGVPVAMYLCPLMSAETPVCALTPPRATEKASLTNQVPDCCAKVIVAERKTIPFVKASENPFSKLPGIAFDFPILQVPETNSGGASFASPFDLPPPGSAPPLFLLHSSFLI